VAIIWTEGIDGWQLLRPSGFPDELTLHELIARAPHPMPLAGNPKMIVLGSEVSLAGGIADEA
jgi:hypothetical protein